MAEMISEGEAKIIQAIFQQYTKIELAKSMFEAFKATLGLCKQVGMTWKEAETLVIKGGLQDYIEDFKEIYETL